MRILRRLLQVILTLLTVAALLVAVVAWNAYRALPRTTGTIELAQSGLSGPVSILRDERGVPTISAASEDDAYFALGYVHAQERLFQMELMRRSGQGRLSELIGRAGLPVDRFVRTLGLYARAEADFAGLDPAVQKVFTRYADGVNAWLAHRDRPLPLEFQLLWFTPEPWRPADSLVWQKLMGLQLSGNWDRELLRAALEAKLGPERAARLWPAPRPGDPVTVPSVPILQKTETQTPAPPAGLADLAPDRLLAALLSGVTPTLASNAWAIAGSRTASGKPLLANDPHLGLQMPNLWYLAILRTPTLSLTGATVPGVPLHLLGHNGHVAWGFTTTDGDTQDLFIEHVLAAGSYETPDGPASFATRAETINVRFGKPVTLAVRETRHGPVLSDILGPDRVPAPLRGEGRVLALEAALLQPGDRTAEALYRMARAADATAFRAATRAFTAPLQNVTFADGQSIGFIAAGHVPIRKAGDGTVPVPGWSGAFDWSGWVPFEDLPQVIDPPEGLIVNANNRVKDGGPFLAANWPEAYRARRILAVLQAARSPLTAQDMAALQTDAVSLAAEELLPEVLPHIQPRDAEEAALLKDMANWDGSMARDRAEPLVFAALLDRLKHATIADDLGDLFDRLGGGRVDLIRNILDGSADVAGVSWCDVMGTPDVETCGQRIQAAWTEAIDWLRSREHRPAADWRWDDFHKATLAHPVFDRLPGLNRIGSRRMGSPGGDYTVNRGSYEDLDAPEPFAHVHGPGYRAVYDLSDPGASRFALAGGESGHPAAAHYDDLLVPWRDGTTFPLAPTVAEGAAEALTLLPGSGKTAN